jgi:hypothetical protein
MKKPPTKKRFRHHVLFFTKTYNKREGSSKGTVGSLDFPGKLNYFFLKKIEASTPITTAYLLNNNVSHQTNR